MTNWYSALVEWYWHWWKDTDIDVTLTLVEWYWHWWRDTDIGGVILTLVWHWHWWSDTDICVGILTRKHGSGILSSTHPTQNGLGSNTGLRNEKSSTDLLSYDTGLQVFPFKAINTTFEFFLSIFHQVLQRFFRYHTFIATTHFFAFADTI